MCRELLKDPIEATSYPLFVENPNKLVFARKIYRFYIADVSNTIDQALICMI